MSRRFLILLPLLLLPACTASTGGPSLARRPVESGDMSEPVRPIATPAPASASLSKQVGDLVARAKQGEQEFAALLPRARSAAAASGKEGSETWLTAQQLLSALEGARAKSTAALSELDALATSALNSDAETGTTELAAANAEVAAIVNKQQAALDEVRTRIR